MTLPVPARLVVLSLIVLPAAHLYLSESIREWQLEGSPAYTLTERFFWGLGLGRALGALLMAAMLLYWRHPASVAVTITTVWLAGPPLTFFWRGIVVLSASAGQSSWAGDPLRWLVPSAAFPILVTAALLAPLSVRRAYAVS